MNKYRGEEFDSEFELDFFNQDYKIDYFLFGDTLKEHYIITNNGEKVYSAIISDINLKKCIGNLANCLDCIVDKYHWYDFQKLKDSLEIEDDAEALKELISSAKDKNKVLSIVTFHF